MLTAHKIKTLQSLDKKKFRQKYNLFLVEGNKIIRELKNSKYLVREVFSSTSEDLKKEGFLDVHEVSYQELKKISFLQNPKDSIAVCEIIPQEKIEKTSIQLVLDGVQDPGNLGTIVRLADWFGIEQIVCSKDTVDFYNPKVIQASMGSFLRVNVIYEDLHSYLDAQKVMVLGTDMEGENLYKMDFPDEFCLVLGNEGNGITPEVKKLVESNITIPRFGRHKNTESLNVSMAAGIILGQIFSKK